MYCRATIRCQASVPAALKEIGQCVSELMQAHSISYRMDVVPEALWVYFRFSKQVIARAKLYMQRCEQSVYARRQGHIAVHCRRNDMKTLLIRKIGEKGLQDLDAEMWSLIASMRREYIVHFITDSKEYSDAAFRKFSNSICYGLHWENLQDTWDEMGYRATCLSDAIDDFAIMSQCPSVWVCPSSSFTEWLQVQEGVTVKCFHTTKNINWHPLSLNARVQIPGVCRLLYLRHCTGWHLITGDGAIPISMRQLSIIRRLTDRNLMTFLTFLEEHGVRPNLGWVSLTKLGRWLGDAEHSEAEDVMPMIENRSEYRQRGDRSQGWQNIFLRVKLFDFLMSRFDVRIRFEQWNGDDTFYFEAPYYLGKREQSWAACEKALQEIRDSVYEDWRPWKRRRS